MADNSPVLICDLDGTILSGNSFPLWLLYLMFGPLPECDLGSRLMLSLRVQRLVLRRRLGRMDHTGLMRGVQQAWYIARQCGSAGLADHMPALLRRQVRPAFEPVLQQIASGEIDAVLATAAAAEYAFPLGLRLGFRYILATPCHLPADGALNHGVEKLRFVQAFLASRQWCARPRVLLTDHIDDLPLALHCHAVGWFGSSAMLAQARAAANDINFVDCRSLDATQLSCAIAALSASPIGARSLADSTSA